MSNSKAQDLMSRLVALGYVDFKAAAIAGNAQQESYFNPSAINKAEGAHGLLQWRLDRYTALLDFAKRLGKPATDLDVQLQFIAEEMSDAEKKAGALFREAKTLDQTMTALKSYIRFGDTSLTKRTNYAKAILADWRASNGTSEANVTKLPTPAATSAPPAPAKLVPVASLPKPAGNLATVEGLQAALNGAYGLKLNVDGIPGRETMGAVERVLDLFGAKHQSWSDARKLLAAEQALYSVHRIVPDEKVAVDGLIGGQTRYLRTVWIAKASGDQKKIDEALNWRKSEPAPAKTPAAPSSKVSWPRQNEGSMNAFFGSRGTGQVTLIMPFPLRIAWEPNKTVSSFSCHSKVRVPMQRIWQRTKDHYGYEEIKRLRLDMYGGCLNVRKMRGGNAWSIHSWGCAYDVDPDRNQLKFTRASASLDNPEYKKFWEFVYDEGAISLGIERDYDWMHFQFAKL